MIEEHYFNIPEQLTFFTNQQNYVINPWFFFLFFILLLETCVSYNSYETRERTQGAFFQCHSTAMFGRHHLLYKFQLFSWQKLVWWYVLLCFLARRILCVVRFFFVLFCVCVIWPIVLVALRTALVDQPSFSFDFHCYTCSLEGSPRFLCRLTAFMDFL